MRRDPAACRPGVPLKALEAVDFLVLGLRLSSDWDVLCCCAAVPDLCRPPVILVDWSAWLLQDTASNLESLLAQRLGLLGATLLGDCCMLCCHHVGAAAASGHVHILASSTPATWPTASEVEIQCKQLSLV